MTGGDRAFATTRARIINGRQVSRQLRSALARRTEALVRDTGCVPGLAVLLVGEDPASAVYVRNKVAACEAVGIHSREFRLPASITTDELVGTIRALNRRADVHGILVQLPLPRHVDVAQVVEAIAIEKDVDGFHLYNVGALSAGTPVFSPCTPFGVMKLLQHEGVDIAGSNAVVVGASNIVGKPMAMMLLQHEATVSICHVATRDLAQFTVLADILVVAAGRPGLVTGPMVKRGAVVIDVGINRLPDGKLVGDVDFAGVCERASLVTPVPGGVGPMTVTMLLENTIAAAERQGKAKRAA